MFLDPLNLKQSNRQLVVEALRVRGAMARVELAEATRLSPATVTAVTADLIADGYIETAAASEDGEDRATATTPLRGRPRVRLQLRPDAAYAAGVKLSMHEIAVAITNFVGEPLGGETIVLRSREYSPEALADVIDDALRQSAAALGMTLDQIAGVGVGMPGFIDTERGVCHWSPIFGAETTPVGELMSRRLGRPTVVDNDANLATLAELWFGTGKGLSNFIVVSIEHGVGMGLVTNGRLYRGARGFGAEFGHTKIQRGGALCRCGQRGCIEAYLADYAILREVATFAPSPEAADPVHAHARLQALLAEARAGDAQIRAIYARAGEVLGVGLANLINVFGPERIILCGEGAGAMDLFEPAMRQALRENALSGAVDQTPVLVSPNADGLWAQGAAALVLERQSLAGRSDAAATVAM